MERETGIEPATNSLEGCDSTTELLPPSLNARFARSFGKPVASTAHPAASVALRFAPLAQQGDRMVGRGGFEPP